MLSSRASVQALAATHDDNGDGLLSFDEYLAARPGGLRNDTSDLPALPPGWAPGCAFGPATGPGHAGWAASATEVVVASVRDGEWIGCHSPSATQARAQAALSQHFEAGESLRGWTLLQVARLPDRLGEERPAPVDVTHGLYTIVSRGVLQLTVAEHGTGATAIFTLPQPQHPAPVPRFFSASFKVQIDGGSGGDGVSWSYGDFANGYVDEMGTGNGVRLLLRTAFVQQASVVYQGNTIDVVTLASEQLRGAWRTVALRLTEVGLSVSLDSTVLFADVQLPGFSPTPQWRMAIGARCGAMNDAHLIDDVVVERGAHLGQGYAPVELAANGRDYSTSTVLFEFYPPPVVTSVEPPCGPVEGGTTVTVKGHNLQRLVSSDSGLGSFGGERDSGYKCGWGVCDCTMRTHCECANITQARWDGALGALVCTSPPWLGDSVNSSGGARQDQFTISLNGQDFSSAGVNFWRYDHPPRGATLLQLDPLGGPVLGGTLVQLRPPGGLPFGSQYVCRFGMQTVPASYGRDTSRVDALSCISPPTDSVGGVEVLLSLNGQQFVPLGLPGEQFAYHAAAGVQSIHPPAGPVHGGTRVQVTGNWSIGQTAPSERLRCRFGHEIVRASRHEDGHALLCEAPKAPGRSSAMLYNGSAPAVDRTTLQLRSDWQGGDSTQGGNLFFGQDAELEYDTVADSGVARALEISFNGLDFSSGGLVTWRWLHPPRVLAVRPSSGPVEGGTAVGVRAKHVWDVPLVQCRFGENIVNATAGAEWFYVEGSPHRELELSCLSPNISSSNPSGGSVRLELSLNGQEFFFDGFKFTYHRSPPPHVSIRPLLGPQLGGTLIALPGDFGRGTEYICRVGDAADGQLVPAQRTHQAQEGGNTTDLLMCSMPSVPETRGFNVALSLNGQQYLGPTQGYQQSFTFHSQMQSTGVAPCTGPAEGATDVLVRLENVSLSAVQLLAALAPQYVCRFDERWQPATLEVPPLPLGEPSNASMPFGPNAVHANLSSHYDLDALNRTCLSRGADLTSRVATLLDNGEGITLSCIEALRLLTLRCTVPPASAMTAGALVLPVAATLNAQDFTTGGGALYHFYSPPHVSSVYPTTGPIDGGTLLTVKGVGLFGLGELLLCRFQTQSGTSTDAARGLVALSQSRPPMLYGTNFLPQAGGPGLYDHLPAMTAATWDDGGEVLRCFTPPAFVTEGNESAALSQPITYHVEVSANGQQFTSNLVPFVEYPPPALSSFTPSGGPITGGTALRLEGLGFRNGSEYLCRFGANNVVVPARMDYAEELLHCRTPAQSMIEPGHDAAADSPRSSAVSISINGQQFSPSLPFEFDKDPIISRISPPGGPQAGGVVVHIYGAHLRPGHLVSGSNLQPLSCAFGDTVVPGTVVNGTGEDGNVIRCLSPARTPGEVDLEVTFNGQDFTKNAIAWLQYDVPSLLTVEPPSGPVRGGTLLVISGEYLVLQTSRVPAEYVCGFGKASSAAADGGSEEYAAVASANGTTVDLPAAITPATYHVGRSALLCYSPVAELAHVPIDSNASGVVLRVALLDPPEQQWSQLETALSYGFYKDARIDSISPRTGPVAGGTLIAISGGLFTRYATGLSMPITPGALLPDGSRDLQRCLLGLSAEGLAQIRSSSLLECTTQSLALSDYVTETALVFDGAAGDVGALGGGELRLLGGASVSDGILHLSSSQVGSAGSAVLMHGFHTPHSPAFDVSFEVALYRPPGVASSTLSGGVSFNFAPWRNTSIASTEIGTGTALTLAMLPATGLQLWWNGHVVASARVASTNGWTPVRIRSNGTHVNVSQLGVPQMENVPMDMHLNGGTPQGDGFAHPRWRFFFGSRATGVKPHKVAQLRVTSVDQLPNITLTVRESPNSQQFGASDVNFTWLLPPAVSSLSPSSGPTFGGTLLQIFGVNLRGGDDYRCRLRSPTHMPANVSEVPASLNNEAGTVFCYTPALSGLPWARIDVTLNGQQFSSSSVNLTVHGSGSSGTTPWPSIVPPNKLEFLDLDPALGPTDGGTVIQVYGIPFHGGTDLRCRFTTSQPLQIIHEVPALLEASSRVALAHHSFKTAANITLGEWLEPGQLDVLTCTIPAHNRSDFVANVTTRVDVTLNGQQYFTSSSLVFRFYNPPLMATSSPYTGPAAGGTVVTISFRNDTVPRVGGATMCRFGDTPVTASFTGGGGDQMQCVSPPALPFEANETIPELLNATGSAQVLTPGWAGRASIVHLTDITQPYGEITDAGSVILYAHSLNGGVMPYAVPPWLRVTLLVRIRGTSARNGLSISYGDVPSLGSGRGLGNWGVGAGLRMSLILARDRISRTPTVRAQMLHMRYDGYPVFACASLGNGTNPAP